MGASRKLNQKAISVSNASKVKKEISKPLDKMYFEKTKGLDNVGFKATKSSIKRAYKSK